MNKTAIKTFAVRARRELIAQVTQKAYEYGITKEKPGDGSAASVGGRLLSDSERSQRAELITRIGHRGFAQVMEETAYTWFNRFIALRFMEVNGYLPSRVRLFTNDKNEFAPEALADALHVEIDGLDRERVIALIESNDTEALYKYLLITQCNALNAGLPGMFEKISSYTELLFPNNLLKSDSVLGRMVADIPEGDWTDAVEIIGWLYQYYNSEPKDEVFALLQKNVKITKERIPAATQLFTPDWIVRYMVENSLGRLWLEGHPDDALKSNWKYYLDEAEQEPEAAAQLEEIRKGYKQTRPGDIKVIDPCMGSGHILVYAFDVLMQIYESCGYSQRDAAKSIAENNLYGLDIDSRAYQLAYFAVMMKGLKYDRRFLSRDIKLNLCAVSESSFLNRDCLKLFGDAEKTANALADEFTDAGELGSIINLKVTPKELEQLRNKLHEIYEAEYHNFFDYARAAGIRTDFEPLIKQAEIMTRLYDAVITNPPYMGSSGMNAKMSDYIKKHYPDSKSDLFAVFMEKCGQMTQKNRYQAMITQHAWMFLSSFEKLREKLMSNDIINMAHLGARAFEEIGGEVVQTTTFVFCKSNIKNYKARYARLVDYNSQQSKETAFLSKNNLHTAVKTNFSKIPGMPIAYWVSENFIRAFDKGVPLERISNTRQGMIPGNTDAFLRLWYEVNTSKIGFGHKNSSDILIYQKKWFPYNKGGVFRRWYGNIEHLINMENDGYDIKYSGLNNNYRLRDPELYFKEAVTWSKISSGAFSARYMPIGCLFDIAGCCIFELGSKLTYILGFCNSIIATKIMNIISPTLNYEVDHIKKFPIIINNSSEIEKIVNDCIKTSKYDWDTYETSWNFKKHPLV